MENKVVYDSSMTMANESMNFISRILAALIKLFEKQSKTEQEKDIVNVFKEHKGNFLTFPANDNFMDLATFVIRNGLEVLMMILLPLMLIPMILGLVISIFQAATQIQDQLLSFLPKLIIILLILYFGFTPGMNLIGSYFQDVMQIIPEYIRNM